MSKEREIDKQLWKAWLEALTKLVEAQHIKEQAECPAAEAEQARDEEQGK